MKIHSSVGTALLYTKISSHHQTKTIHKKQYFFQKYQEKQESIHIKVLYNVDKTAHTCYKKVEELCEAAPYC